MRPHNLTTKIFCDGGDPVETRELLKLLGFLDGQTTNPSLIAKNPEAKAKIDRGEKFTVPELLGFYEQVVMDVSKMIPQGSVSIEVYADKDTKAQAMVGQARDMYQWIPNAQIKFPTTYEGLLAAEIVVHTGMRVNLTLCFTQAQAAAVYAATRGAKIGQVFVSPFVGRLDDRGENGIDLIKNITQMYQDGDRHVEVLTASVRSLDHFYYALALQSDIITAPFKVIKDWAERGQQVPENYTYHAKQLKPIPYQQLDLRQSWQEFNLKHELTDIGIEKFSADWNSLLKLEA